MNEQIVPELKTNCKGGYEVREYGKLTSLVGDIDFRLKDLQSRLMLQTRQYCTLLSGNERQIGGDTCLLNLKGKHIIREYPN